MEIVLLLGLLGLGVSISVQAPVGDAVFEQGFPEAGTWCCDRACGSSFKSASPRVDDICSFEIHPHKWWFLVRTTVGHSLLCFSKDPDLKLPQNCSRHIKYVNSSASSILLQFLRLITFTCVILTPAVLTIINPFDLRP